MKQSVYIILFLFIISCGKKPAVENPNDTNRWSDPGSNTLLENGQREILKTVCHALSYREIRFENATSGTDKYYFVPTIKTCDQENSVELAIVMATLKQANGEPFFFSGSDNIFSDIVSVQNKKSPMEFPCSRSYGGQKAYAGEREGIRYVINLGRKGTDLLVVLYESLRRPNLSGYDPLKKITYLVDGNTLNLKNYGMVKQRTEQKYSCPNNNKFSSKSVRLAQ